MHPAEIEQELESFKIIVDTREQKWQHIECSLKATGTPYERCKLDFGDYSCTVGDGRISFFDKVVIERKANLDEIAGNFTKGRERFDREFKRAVDSKAKVFLIIENASWEDIKNHNYRSRFSPKSFIATLLAWQARFNITVFFCKQNSSGDVIKGILWYFAKEYLKNVEADNEE